jgi:hypothetical protein
MFALERELGLMMREGSRVMREGKILVNVSYIHRKSFYIDGKDGQM